MPRAWHDGCIRFDGADMEDDMVTRSAHAADLAATFARMIELEDMIRHERVCEGFSPDMERRYQAKLNGKRFKRELYNLLDSLTPEQVVEFKRFRDSALT